jgi:hypothetical protein
MSEQTAPRIDDAYWFDWSRLHLDSALERRDAAFGRLQGLVLWLWGIYTTFAATGFALSAKALSVEVAASVGMGSVLLIAVYWACVWGQMPVPVLFDPRSPTEISAAHQAMIRSKDTRLVVTMLLSLAAAGAVALALLTAGATPDRARPRLEIAAIPAADSAMQLAVTAHVKPRAQATLTAVADPPASADSRLAPQTLLATEEGLVQTAMRLPRAARYRVAIVWQDEGVEVQLARVVAPAPAASR